MARLWTDAEIQALRDAYKARLPWETIAAAVGRTALSCEQKAQKIGLKKSRSYTAKELSTVEQLYAETDTAEIARQLGRTVSAVYNMAFNLGLKKSPEYMKVQLAELSKNLLESGKAHRYPKGHVPASKGTKGIYGVHQNSRRTQFKKGERTGFAKNLYQPIGTERISKDGYLERKVNDDLPLQARWKAVHRIVWEEHNCRPVPDGHAIVFRDNNKLNHDPSNLELVTRAELMKRNTMHNFPEPVKQQIHILAGFKRRLNSHAKKQNRRSA